MQLVLGYLDELFWRFLAGETRAALAPAWSELCAPASRAASSSSLEVDVLLRVPLGGHHAPTASAFSSACGGARRQIPGLTLAEPDEATMALELAVRGRYPAAATILEEQRDRFTNPDRKARFEFVMPALSERPRRRATRSSSSLADVKNRRREPWVSKA